jgi:hypothetical protein
LNGGGKLDTPKLFFTPTLTWEHASFAIGYAMPIERIEFTADNKLLFQTSSNGFGLYDGQKVLMLK